MAKEKPTYKMSASLINTWLYHKKTNFPGSIDQLRDYIEGEFKDNKWTLRGKQFEAEVFKGKHGKLSQLVEKLPKQVWMEKYVSFGDFYVRLAGKTDAMDTKNGTIYDIKRVDKFTEDKYDYSFQHTLYFYLQPDIKEFYYLVTDGVDSDIKGHHVIKKLRPEEDDLRAQVAETLSGFIEFLKEHDLWELYKEKQKYKGR